MALTALGVIPARAGSKGIAAKNVREVAGKPLVAYAIETALNTPELAATVVTTDDPQVRSIAEEMGAAVVERPEHLAGDDAPMAPVLQHAVEAAEADGYRVDVVVLLQPTAPIRRPADVKAVLAILEGTADADSVVSVVQVEDAHPGRMYRMDDAGRMEPVWPEWERVNRQELPPVFLRNGALYAVRRGTLMAGQVIGSSPRAYRMPATWLANVDDERDLIVTEALLTAWREGGLG